ncbi:AtzE family amidohydrolase [Limnohabitans sp. INBF002]|uniref:AtzE family amidohydrolase n=1 Tax=Limnohabitans sp. INBF002 TaxID=2986280 RepID=UPI00237756A5|nr:AtzE family amidohydrolase [Limnohabitans sp. INBF002]BDU52403.1 amidase [Limnohabitans sp. INBF002]
MDTQQLSTEAVAQGIANGQFTASEVLVAYMQRIETTDAKVNAFTTPCFERAVQEAKAIDQRRTRGDTLPPLAGVPYAVKNLYDIQGTVTLAGSTVNQTNPPAQADAFLVQQMQAAGAVLVGALNMDEFAYGFTTENTHYGPSHNPHDLSRIAGGSSGGSGAAVAARQVPLSLGSDTNGSIRVPASLCGVWGLKPTFGRLSRRGTYPFVHSIDHLGPFADSLQGLGLAYDALQGVDAYDPGCHAKRVEPVSSTLHHGLHGLRIGVLDGYFHDFATAPARQVVQDAAHALGVTQTLSWPEAAMARAAAFIITASEGGQLHLDHLRTQADAMEPLSVDRFIAGALQPAAWYVQAQRFRRIYREKVNALFEDWDVLLAPATPVSAPTIGTEWLDLNGQQLPSRAAMGLLTQPISFAGCPVVVAPMWPNGTEGMPLGVQVIAAPWREEAAFRVAHVLSQSGAAGLKKMGF